MFKVKYISMKVLKHYTNIETLPTSNKELAFIAEAMLLKPDSKMIPVIVPLLLFTISSAK